MHSRLKAVVFYVVLILVAIVLWAVVRGGNSPAVAYTQLLDEVKSGEVRSATIIPRVGVARVDYRLKNGTSQHSFAPANYRDVLKAMQQSMVSIQIKEAFQWINATPFLLLLAAWVIAMIFLKRGERRGSQPGPA